MMKMSNNAKSGAGSSGTKNKIVRTIVRSAASVMLRHPLREESSSSHEYLPEDLTVRL